MNEFIQKLILHPSSSLLESLNRLDAGGVGFVFVVGEDGVLQGVVTDGDVRRGLLRGETMSSPISRVMNANYKFWQEGMPRDAAISYLKSIHRRQLPVITRERKLVDLILLDDLEFETMLNPVVLMAGGLGTRLRPLTNDVPKPMLKVRGKPILESLLERVMDQGFRRFYFCVNFGADQIESYFGDGSKWNISIEYLREEQRLGTAGGLGLLSPHLSCEKLPIVVMNGDLMTNADLNGLLAHHRDQKSQATMCVCPHKYQIPYGVVETKEAWVVGLAEKPVHECLVNAGIYAINPGCLQHIPPQQYFDMTDLFGALLDQNILVSAFPLQEYWLDIGCIEDFERAQALFRSTGDK
jgi:dTDP-glucose pyrophosphorylase/CBS domain-containing protein